MKVFASLGAMGSLSVGAAARQYPGVGFVPRAQPTILRERLLLLKTTGCCHKCQGNAYCLQKPLPGEPGRKDRAALLLQNYFYLFMCKKETEICCYF